MEITKDNIIKLIREGTDTVPDMVDRFSMTRSHLERMKIYETVQRIIRNNPDTFIKQGKIKLAPGRRMADKIGLREGV